MIWLTALFAGTLRSEMADPTETEPLVGRHGVAYPQGAVTGEDRERWDNSLTVASDALQLPPEAEQVQQTARVIYADRETYPS